MLNFIIRNQENLKRNHVKSHQSHFKINCVVSVHFQFKYFDKEEFKDLKLLKQLYLDGNQLSVVIDHLFQRQRVLEHLGELYLAYKGRFKRKSILRI